MLIPISGHARSTGEGVAQARPAAGYLKFVDFADPIREVTIARSSIPPTLQYMHAAAVTAVDRAQYDIELHINDDKDGTILNSDAKVAAVLRVYPEDVTPVVVVYAHGVQPETDLRDTAVAEDRTQLTIDYLRAQLENEDKDVTAQKNGSAGSAVRLTMPSKFNHLVGLSTFLNGSGMAYLPARLVRRIRGAPALLTYFKKTGGAGRPFTNERHDTPQKVIEHYLWGNPIFGKAILDIHKVINSNGDKKKKALVMAHSPKTSWYFYNILAFMGVRVAHLHGKMSAGTSIDIIDAFNTEPGPQVLVSTYLEELQGVGCHHYCAAAFELEPSFNPATKNLTERLLRRVGQSEEVKALKYTVKDTFTSNVLKASSNNR